MLIRICLILAIVAGLALLALNLAPKIGLREKITLLANDRDNEKKMKEDAQTDARTTHAALDKTTAQLKQTQTELTATKEQRDSALADVAAKTKLLDKTTGERDSARKDRDEAQQELSAYKATDLKPEEIVAIRKQFKALNDTIEVAQIENKTLNRKIKQLQTELDRYVDPNKPVYLPASLLGKVLVTDPKWNFVVLNVGVDQGAKEYGQLLVNRNGKLVAKVIIRSVQKDQCIANVMPGWELGPIIEGDQAIPAYPES